MITGLTYVHNAVERDYCIAECVASLLGLCEEVIVMDCQSTDGTPDIVRRISKKVRIQEAPFELSTKGHNWILESINRARMFATTPYVLQLDADEVIHEDDYPHLAKQVFTGRPAYLERKNFWISPDRVLPEGKVVGSSVCRMAPREYMIFSDEPHPEGVPPVVRDAIKNPASVYHYGFIRDPRKFKIKAKEMMEGYGHKDAYDYSLLDREGLATFNMWVKHEECHPFRGRHPKVIHKWLQDRGHKI